MKIIERRQNEIQYKRIFDIFNHINEHISLFTVKRIGV